VHVFVRLSVPEPQAAEHILPYAEVGGVKSDIQRATPFDILTSSMCPWKPDSVGPTPPTINLSDPPMEVVRIEATLVIAVPSTYCLKTPPV